MTLSNNTRSTLSKNGVPIRLTEERRQHIKERHPDVHDHLSEIFQTISDPDFIQEGNSGALVAFRLSATFNGKHVKVVYQETAPTDGFIRTAYATRKLSRRIRVLWGSFPFPESENP